MNEIQFNKGWFGVNIEIFEKVKKVKFTILHKNSL